MQPTRRGDDLALKLIGDYHLRLICAQICSAASSFSQLAVLGLNQELTEAEVKRYDRLGDKLKKLAAELGDGWSVTLDGDPRGVVVKLVNPDQRDRYDSFGGDGVCVP